MVSYLCRMPNARSIYSTHKALLLICFVSLVFIQCKNSTSSNRGSNFDTDLRQTGRDTWQKPELVIDVLGDISDKTIADIGAGTGYFTFRMAFEAKKVIAIEIDPAMIELIEVFQENLPERLEGKVEARLVQPDNPGLKPGEADIAVIINTIAYIENPVNYLSLLKEQVSDDGFIMIIDFKNNYIPIDAPPMSERLGSDQVIQMLKDSGWDEIIENRTSLDYQYIITAYK